MSPPRAAATRLAPLLCLALAAACSGTGSTTSSSGTTAGSAVQGTAGTTPGGATFVYWDQNEEQEYMRLPDTTPKVLVPPWDPNGQMCILPDNSGRFVTGYNPTNPDSQGSNPGSKLPFKDPPVGEALWNADGSFSGTTFYVPGPYKNTVQGGGSTNNRDAGGDIPPDRESAGQHFNANGSMTGCAFGRDGNLFASDLGTAQGQIPPPDNGRVIMWWAPDYKEACIVVGPTQGGDGPHHVGGTGGLRNPGTMTADAEGNVYVPEAGSVDPSGAMGHGRVIKIDTSTVPRSPADCPDQMPARQASTSVFIDDARQPYPLGIAVDPTCDCFAVTSVIGDTAVAWYDRTGKPVDRPPVPGRSGDDGYSPFGLAFLPDGTLFFIDIHVACKADGCGPTDGLGSLYRVTFGPGRVPATPERLTTGMDFPTSVTTCDGSQRVCPQPTADHGPPLRSAPGGE